MYADAAAQARAGNQAGQPHPTEAGIQRGPLVRPGEGRTNGSGCGFSNRGHELPLSQNVGVDPVGEFHRIGVLLEDVLTCLSSSA